MVSPKNVRGWAWTIDITVLSTSIVGAGLCFIFDRQIHKHTARTVRSALNEIDSIREKFDRHTESLTAD